MKNIQCTLIFFICIILTATAQKKNILFDLSSSAGYTSKGLVPFWLRSNQFGSIPVDNGSLSFISRIHKEYPKSKPKLIDWGFSLEGRANLGYKSNITIIEGYSKIRICIFEIRAGRARELMGLCDSSLTSGAWAVSGTSLGIPKLEVSIPEFYTLPFLGRLFAFKGNYAHGWIGETLQSKKGTVLHIGTYLHQKSLYGRFGKPLWKLKLYGGFNHQVMWGNEKEYWGNYFPYSQIKTYLYVITGRSWDYSRMGNSLGSIDLGIEYVFKNLRMLAYRQNLYDAGALYYLANISDGLNGLSISNIKFNKGGFQWRKMLLEVLYTKNQAGEAWSKLTPSGDENYFNHYQYIKGWSYKGIGIGNPFITSRNYIREGLAADPTDYFINNRVVAFHFGFEGSIQNWDFILKTSYSLNYGTYGTSEVGHTVGKVRTIPVYGLFGEKKQFSAYMNAGRELKNGLNISLTGAFDVGELYYNSVGALFSLSKTF